MSQHTPGPWEFRCDENGTPYVGAGCFEIAHIFTTSNQKEREANARLIAAAPDLLESLKGAVTRFEILMLRGDLNDNDPQPEGKDATKTEGFLRLCRAAIAKAGDYDA